MNPMRSIRRVPQMTVKEQPSAPLVEGRKMDDLSEEERRSIRAAQIGAVLNLVPVTVAINVLNAAIVITANSDRGQSGVLIAWASTLLLLLGVSTFSWLRFRKSPPTGGSNGALNRITIHAFLLAGIWTVIPTLFFPDTSAVNQVLIACLVSGMMGGGALCLSTVPRAGLLYTWTFAAGGAAALLLDDEPRFVYGLMLLVLYAVFMSRTLTAYGRLFISNQLNRVEMSRQTELIGLLLKNFEENSSDWLWETDAIGTLVRLSDRLVDVTQRSRAELQNMTVADLLRDGSADPSATIVDLQSKVANRDAFRDLIVPVRVGGESRFWSITGAPEYDRSGRYTGYRGIGTDVTDRWMTQQKLAEQAEQFESALENMPQGMCMFDADFRLLVCNRRYIEMYGLQEQDVAPGTHILELTRRRVNSGLLPAVDMERTKAIISQPVRPTSAQFVSRLQDGRIISISAEQMPGGGCIVIHNDISEQRRAEEQMRYLAHHDALTGLPNRVVLREEMIRCLDEQDAKFSVLALDLDLFKEVNDTLGHPAGDELLKFVAQRLRATAGQADFVARQGGDEFVILQRRLGDAEPGELAGRVIEALKQPYRIAESEVVIGASIGIATAPTDAKDADQLLKFADLAMYRAKERGRNAFAFFEQGMDVEMHERRALEIDLRRAVEFGELELYYQPSVTAVDGTVSCLEALLRWNHPTRGMISPATFIPLAEETGLIIGIGEWVLRSACVEASRWPSNVSVAVNLSPVQFRSKDLAGMVTSAIASAGLDPRRVELEITESVMLQDSAANIAILHRLRSLGVKIVMDDFGTGYSSLGYLRSFPFDKIKIDRSFVKGAIDKEATAIIRAVCGLSADLGITTTVEGVETQDQLKHVTEAGCDQIQGYYFSRPRPAADVAELLVAIEGVAAISPQFKAA
jgi:diguanylate cyclase (GGDEF)-like protein/PAS domain S-box-containing protein